MRSSFKIRGCRGNAADGVDFSRTSASSRRQLRGGGPRQSGSLIAELLVAIAILAGVLLPIAYSLGTESALTRMNYQHIVAMEIVDGEIETLAAGGWRSYSPGTHPYVVHAESAANLPPGQFLLTIQTNRIRLEWRPDAKHHGGAVVREVTVR